MRILAGAATALRRIVDLGLVVLIVVVLLGVILGKGAPLVGRQSIVIGGGSMEPTLGLGAAILVKPADPASLAVGDIVSLRVGPEQTTYTHRIVAVIDRADGRWIRTKGDANAAPDPSLVPVSAVIGRVELAIPLAGYLLALLSLPVGVMFVLGLAATLLAVAWLLESLELEPRAARPASAGDPPPVESPARPGAVALRPDLLDGEPIALRPTGAIERGFAVGTWVYATPFAAPAMQQSPARPTVRAQIQRSREVRQRRARWQLGQAQDRRAVD